MSIQSRLATRLARSIGIALAITTMSLAAVSQPDAPRHVSRTDPDADFDGDGVVNAMDNCLVSPNPDQRDTDHDGIGNACDADFNNDGVVDDADLTALTRAFGTNARDKDLNGDGEVNEKDLQILLELFKRAPGPRLDSDGDGVADLEDPCPGASVGTPSSVPGCTALALLQEPDAIVGPLTSITGRLVNDLRASVEMLAVRMDLETSIDDLTVAERIIRRGDVCDSSRLFAHADERLAAALDSIERQLAEARAVVRAESSATGGGSPATAPSYPADVTEADLLVAWLTYWSQQVDSVRAWNRGDAGAFAAICAAAHPGTARGVIQTIDDAQRRIVLTDGRTLALADPISLTDDVYEGRAVEVGGLMFDDGNGQATTLKYDGAAPSVPNAAYVNCTALRFAPVQRFPPYFSGPFVLHDPLGYKEGDVYTVEAGMAVAAQAKCSPGQGGTSYPRYSLKVQISYKQTKTAVAIDHATMAPELTPSDAPVVFAKDIDEFAPATLHVTSEVRSCTKLQNRELCADPVPIEPTKDYPLVVRARGGLAFALYDQTEFDVNDQKSSDFRFAHVSFFTLLANVDANTSMTFVAEGYGPFFDGITEGPVVNGDPFAIRNVDYYPIFPAVTPLGILLEQGAAALSGVDRPAGLRWPRVQGIRNGREFWYSATLPFGIVRDVVNFCPSPNAYYRLPFAEGVTFVQGQGNHPELPENTPGVTHSGGYAYDMLAPLATPIYAARAGRVVQVQESLNKQCDIADKDCEPNNVFVKHQDGSIGEYAHMPQDSVLPEVGDLVQRGEWIAVVGLVGRTSGPHLHFATRTQPKPGGDTFLAKFEAFVFAPGEANGLTTCYVPQEGHILMSNNKVQ